ncbi:MAG: hypothetical protein Kow00133_05120 [Amphiplicatus sp.]
MKTFLAVYMARADSPKTAAWNKLDDAARQEKIAAGMKAWSDWMAANKTAVVVEGGPLGKTKRTDAQGVADTKNAMTGYVVVAAQTHEAAARLFENHPHFTIFPGESVEIMECLPIPGQG